jgi:hypothetical protein
VINVEPQTKANKTHKKTGFQRLLPLEALSSSSSQNTDPLIGGL